MGLRISAYTGVVPEESLSEEERKETPEECFLEIRNPERYAARLQPLRDGVYVYGRLAQRENIGSYGYYSEWRDWLSRSYVGVPAADIDPRKHQGQPFFELIDFPDSSSFLGPEVAEKLSWNFDGWEHDSPGR